MKINILIVALIIQSVAFSSAKHLRKNQIFLREPYENTQLDKRQVYYNQLSQLRTQSKEDILKATQDLASIKSEIQPSLKIDTFKDQQDMLKTIKNDGQAVNKHIDETILKFKGNPIQKETIKVAETPKIVETPKIAEIPKAAEVPKIQESSQVTVVPATPITEQDKQQILKDAKLFEDADKSQNIPDYQFGDEEQYIPNEDTPTNDDDTENYDLKPVNQYDDDYYPDEYYPEENIDDYINYQPKETVNDTAVNNTQNLKDQQGQSQQPQQPLQPQQPQQPQQPSQPQQPQQPQQPSQPQQPQQPQQPLQPQQPQQPKEIVLKEPDQSVFDKIKSQLEKQFDDKKTNAELDVNKNKQTVFNPDKQEDSTENFKKQQEEQFEKLRQQYENDKSKDLHVQPLDIKNQQPAVVVQGQQPAVVVQGQQPAVAVQGQQPAVAVQGQQPAVVQSQQPVVVITTSNPQNDLLTNPSNTQQPTQLQPIQKITDQINDQNIQKIPQDTDPKIVDTSLPKNISTDKIDYNNHQQLQNDIDKKSQAGVAEPSKPSNPSNVQQNSTNVVFSSDEVERNVNQKVLLKDNDKVLQDTSSDITTKAAAPTVNQVVTQTTKQL